MHVSNKNGKNEDVKQSTWSQNLKKKTLHRYANAFI